MTVRNPEHAIELLKQKWDNEQAFSDSGLLRYCRDNIGTNYHRNAIYDPRGRQVAQQLWWAYREEARIDTGIYASSAVLTALRGNCLYQYFPHVSKDDPTMIAYTPSFESAVADKQVKTTLGRFLRKHAFFLTDDNIRELDAAHRAELTIEIKYAVTKDEIEFVYTNMDGDSGCMRYKGGHWSLPKDMHPSHVYEAPGMAVAYTQTEDGTIKSRSLVWTNPDDPTDKRYLRLYGDTNLLKNKLEREGFQLKHFGGARIKRIPHPRDPESSYLMPYIDGPGGDQSNEHGRWVMLDSDPKYIKIVGRGYADKINRLRRDTAAMAGNHSGVRVSLAEPPNTTGVCGLSGATFDKLDSNVSVVKVLLKSGEIVDATAAAVSSETGGSYRLARMQHKGSLVSVYIGAYEYDGLIAKPDLFNHEYNTYVDNAETRGFCGFVRLSGKYYEDDKTYVLKDGLEQLVDGSYIKRDDALTIMADECGSTVHISELEAWREKGFVNASPLVAKRRALINPKGEQTGRTRGGTYFHKRIQADKFTELFDGTWAEASKVDSVYVFGTYVKYLRSEPAPDTQDVNFLSSVLPKSALMLTADSLRVSCLQSTDATTARRYYDSLGETLRAAVHRYGGVVPRMTGVDAEGKATYEAGRPSMRWFDVRTNIATWRAHPQGETLALAAQSNAKQMFAVYDTVNTGLGWMYDVMADHTRQLLAQEKDAKEAARLAAEALAKEEAERNATRVNLQAEIDKLLDGLDAA